MNKYFPLNTKSDNNDFTESQNKSDNFDFNTIQVC